MHTQERLSDGVGIAFDDHGQGPAVVLLHAFPLDGRMWADNVPSLIEAGYRVIALDYPGFGDSPPPPAPLSIAALADVVRDLLDRLKVETAAVVGLSMGGYVALAFAHAHPERLWALVLADTRAAADSPEASQGRAAALATIANQGVEAYLAGSLPRLLAPHASPQVLSRVRALAERREDTLTGGIAALRDRPDRSGELPGISCPTLVLAGASDQITPAAEMRTMAASIPRGRFEELAHAGHLSCLEAIAEFNQALVAFLRELNPRPNPTRINSSERSAGS